MVDRHVDDVEDDDFEEDVLKEPHGQASQDRCIAAARTLNPQLLGVCQKMEDCHASRPFPSLPF